ncbi:MAG: hypothetical protein CL691_06600 [Cellvibrionales bacterium]|nr:hypothetical protein [Cellvibrionales bacterium]
MSFLLIISSLFWSACAWNLFRPSHHKAVIGIFSFLLGIVTGELALFLIPWQVLLAGLMINAGAITGIWTTLALLIWFIAGVAQLVYLINSSLSGQALRQVLDNHQIPPLLPSEAGQQRQQFWPRVRRPFAIRLNGVRCEKDVVYGEADGETLKLDIYQSRTQQDDQSSAPVMLYIHGGGLLEQGGTKKGQGLPLLNEFAQRGWVCVSIDYRLSPTHKWPAHLIDCKAALQWIKKNISDYGGDPDFVITAGDSAGGQLSAMMALTANEPQFQPRCPDLDSRIQGALCFYGVMDFCNLFDQAHNDELAGYSATQIIDASLDDPGQSAVFESANAIASINKQTDSSSIPDCAIIHGDCDSLIAIDESTLFAEKLQQVSENKVIYSGIPGAQHAYNMFRSIRSELVLNELVRLACYFEKKHQA